MPVINPGKAACVEVQDIYAPHPSQAEMQENAAGALADTAVAFWCGGGVATPPCRFPLGEGKENFFDKTSCANNARVEDDRAPFREITPISPLPLPEPVLVPSGAEPDAVTVPGQKRLLFASLKAEGRTRSRPRLTWGSLSALENEAGTTRELFEAEGR